MLVFAIFSLVYITWYPEASEKFFLFLRSNKPPKCYPRQEYDDLKAELERKLEERKIKKKVYKKMLEDKDKESQSR